MATMTACAVLFTGCRGRGPAARKSSGERTQERAMSKFKDLGQYVELAIIGVLAVAALAGIIRFIILADVF